MLQTLRRAKNMGVFDLPIHKIATLFKHRNKLNEMERALFYHRYCNALFLAQKTGIFAALSQQSYPLQRLSEQVSIPERTLRTLMFVLTSQGFVEEKNGQYQLSEFGELFINGDNPFASNYLLDLMANQAFGFSSTLDSVRDGSTPTHADVANPELRGAYHAFLTAVNSYLYGCARELVQKVDLGNIRTMIAGSMGVSFSSVLLKQFPALKANYACLDHLAQEIPSLCQQYDIPQDRIIDIRSHEGDPSEDDWGSESYDLVFLTRKMILDPRHQLGEKFAQKAFQVLEPGGKAIFWELVYPDRGKMPLSRAMEAMFDFCASPAAIPRTETDYRQLFQAIGFKHISVQDCLEGQTTFIIAEK